MYMMDGCVVKQNSPCVTIHRPGVFDLQMRSHWLITYGSNEDPNHKIVDGITQSQFSLVRREMNTIEKYLSRSPSCTVQC